MGALSLLHLPVPSPPRDRGTGQSSLGTGDVCRRDREGVSVGGVDGLSPLDGSSPEKPCGHWSFECTSSYNSIRTFSSKEESP